MAAAKTAKTTETTAPAEDKVVTPREDPIARATRLLEETVQKAKDKAASELEKAVADLEASERNVAKAVRVRNERQARVDRLEAHAQGNAAHAYAAALGTTEITDGDVDLTEGAPEAEAE